MKQYRITSDHITPRSNDDCFLAPNDPAQELIELQFLGGIGAKARLQEYNSNSNDVNISNTGTENAELMRKHNIRPGTPEWFQLWFSLPYMTGEKKVGK
jgi:hypothetical protein